MILSDFLSRQKHDNSSSHEIISICFNMLNVLHDRYYNLGSWLVFSGTEHLVEVLDKLSSTSVDFFRSERELENMSTEHAQRHAG